MPIIICFSGISGIFITLSFRFSDICLSVAHSDFSIKSLRSERRSLSLTSKTGEKSKIMIFTICSKALSYCPFPVNNSTENNKYLRTASKSLTNLACSIIPFRKGKSVICSSLKYFRILCEMIFLVLSESSLLKCS